VYAALARRGVEVSVIDPSILSGQKLTVSSIDDEAIVRLDDGSSLAINQDARIWIRRPRMPEEAHFESADVRISEFKVRNYRAAWECAYATPAAWMNPTASSRPLERNKLLQTRIAEESGLITIPTLLTDDPEEYSHFVRLLDGVPVAVKSPIPGNFPIADSKVPYGTYTRLLSHDQALSLAPRVAFAPILVQPYVQKDYELRITVVAGRIFSCRINSQDSSRTEVDWRHYDLRSVSHTPVLLDSELESAINRFMDKSGLLFAAIDMIVEPGGQHRFVEANPSGQFGWIEALAGLDISGAIADWLGGRSRLAPGH
jgi:glutathione synthase/RimK-type ligase-like ATP-grasp enzyme